MSATTVNFPQHFPSLPATVRLIALTGDAGLPYRVWFEAALDGRVERPLTGLAGIPLVGTATGIPRLDWSASPEVVNYGNYLGPNVGTSGGSIPVMSASAAAELFRSLVESGFLLLREDGDKRAFVVARFWECNPHFRRGFFDERQRGAYVKAANAHRRDAEALARKQVELWERRSALPLFAPADGEAPPDRARIEAGVALILRLDRATGRSLRPDYDPDIVDMAARVLSAHADDGTLEAVIPWILHNRSNPDYAPTTEKVLRDYEFYARESRA